MNQTKPNSLFDFQQLGPIPFHWYAGLHQYDCDLTLYAGAKKFTQSRRQRMLTRFKKDLRITLLRMFTRLVSFLNEHLRITRLNSAGDLVKLGRLTRAIGPSSLVCSRVATVSLESMTSSESSRSPKKSICSAGEVPA